MNVRNFPAVAKTFKKALSKPLKATKKSYQKTSNTIKNQKKEHHQKPFIFQQRNRPSPSAVPPKRPSVSSPSHIHPGFSHFLSRVFLGRKSLIAEENTRKFAKKKKNPPKQVTLETVFKKNVTHTKTTPPPPMTPAPQFWAFNLVSLNF